MGKKISIGDISPEEYDIINDVIGADELLKEGYKEVKKMEKNINEEKVTKEKEEEVNIEEILGNFRIFVEKKATLLAKVKEGTSITDSYLNLTEKNRYYKLSSDDFKRRFLLFFIDMIDKNIVNILDSNYKYFCQRKSVTKKDRYTDYYGKTAKKILLLLQEEISLLIDSMFYGKDFSDIMTNLSFDLMGCCRAISSAQVASNIMKKKLKGSLLYLKDACQKDTFGNMNEYEDVIIINLLRSAYLFTVNPLYVEKLPKYKTDNSLDDDNDEIVIEHGSNIVEELEEGNEFNPIFIAFEKAMPLIQTGIKGINEFTEINISVKSLILLAFLSNDKNVFYAVEKLLR